MTRRLGVARTVGLIVVAAGLALVAVVADDALAGPTTGTVDGVLETSLMTPMAGVVTIFRLATVQSVTDSLGRWGNVIPPGGPGVWIPTGSHGARVTWSQIDMASTQTIAVGTNGKFSISVAPAIWILKGGNSRSTEACQGGPVEVDAGQRVSVQVQCDER